MRRVCVWTLTFLVIIGSIAVGAKPMTFAWDTGANWPTGAASELVVNGVSVSGIVGAQYSLDVSVEPAQTINAKVRGVAPDGTQSDWATLATVIPAIQAAPTKAVIVEGGTTVAAIPSPWVEADIGATGAAGSSDYASGLFSVSGAGADIWGNADAFHFVYYPVTGNTTITARVISLSATHAQAKAGVMIRDTLDAGARYVGAFANVNSNTVSCQRRFTASSSTLNIGSASATAPVWVRIVRAGTLLTGYWSADGTTWSTLGGITIS